MTPLLEPSRSLDQVLREILSRNASATIRPRDEGGWTVRRFAKVLPEVHADAGAEGWSLRVPLAHARPTADQYWRALEWNHSFDTGAKLVLEPDGLTLGLRAELPLDDDVDPVPSVRRAFDGLVGAIQLTRQLFAGQPAPSALNSLAGEAHDRCDLTSLCAGSDWSSHARANGFAMTLETPAGFHQAFVEQDARWGVVARVELLAVGETTDSGRRATGRFLLEASRLIRFARAIRWSLPDGKQGLGFEVLLGWAVTPRQFSSALAALSVACRMCAREIGSLGDERIARAYLRLGGESS
jgi:hypothetical protein